MSKNALMNTTPAKTIRGSKTTWKRRRSSVKERIKYLEENIEGNKERCKETLRVDRNTLPWTQKQLRKTCSSPCLFDEIKKYPCGTQPPNDIHKTYLSISNQEASASCLNVNYRRAVSSEQRYRSLSRGERGKSSSYENNETCESSFDDRDDTVRGATRISDENEGAMFTNIHGSSDKNVSITQKRGRSCDLFKRDTICDGNILASKSRDSSCDTQSGASQSLQIPGGDEIQLNRPSARIHRARSRVWSCDELDTKIETWRKSYEKRHSSSQTREKSCDKKLEVQNQHYDQIHSNFPPIRGASCHELNVQIEEKNQNYHDIISVSQTRDGSLAHSTCTEDCEDRLLDSQSCQDRLLDSQACEDRKSSVSQVNRKSSDERKPNSQFKETSCDEKDLKLQVSEYGSNDTKITLLNFDKSFKSRYDDKDEIIQTKDKSNVSESLNTFLGNAVYDEQVAKDDRDGWRDGIADRLHGEHEGWRNSVFTEKMGKTCAGEQKTKICTLQNSLIETINSNDVDTNTTANDDTAPECQNSLDKMDGWQHNPSDRLGYRDEKCNLSRSWPKDAEDYIKRNHREGFSARTYQHEGFDALKIQQVDEEDIKECRASVDTVTQCRERSEAAWAKEVTLSPGFCRGDDEEGNEDGDSIAGLDTTNEYSDSIAGLETIDKSGIIGLGPYWLSSAGSAEYNDNDDIKARFRANDDEMGGWRGQEGDVDIAPRVPELVNTPSTGESHTDTKQRLIHKLNTDQTSKETRYQFNDRKELENKSTYGIKYQKQQLLGRDCKQKQVYCVESDLDVEKGEEAVQLQQVDEAERRNSQGLELSDSQESIERRRRCDRRRGSNPERELDRDDTETAEFQTSLRKVSSSRPALHKPTCEIIANRLSDGSHASQEDTGASQELCDEGSYSVEKSEDDGNVGDDCVRRLRTQESSVPERDTDTENNDECGRRLRTRESSVPERDIDTEDGENCGRRLRARESSVPERDIDTEDARTADLQLKLRKQIHQDKKQPELDSSKSDILSESQRSDPSGESEHIYTSETFAFSRSFQDPIEESERLVVPSLPPSLEDLPLFSPLTRLPAKMPQNLRRSRSFPGRSFRGLGNSKGPRSGSGGPRTNPAQREGITYDMVSDKGLPPPPALEENVRKLREGRSGLGQLARPPNPELVPRPVRKWHLPRSTRSTQAVKARIRSNNEQADTKVDKEKSPESDSEVEYECTVVCRQGGVLYGSSGTGEEDQVEGSEEGVMEDDGKLPELDPQQRMQLMQVIASMESVRKAGGGGGDSPPPTDLEMQQFIDYMEMGVINEDRLDYEERKKREFDDEEEECEPEPPKRNKQANQYFWRRHYLSIIQEEEEQSEMNSRSNSRPSSCIFTNTRPSSSYENTWAQKTDMQGIRNANEIMEQLNPFSSPDTSLTLTPHKTKDSRTSWGSEMSIDSIASINSILSEEGSLTSNASLPVDTETSKEAADPVREECERRASQSLSHLLDSVQPPSNTPDSMLGYNIAESMRGCESPVSTTSRTHQNLKSQNTSTNQKSSIIETSNPFIEAQNPFLQASNPFLDGNNPFLEHQSDAAPNDSTPSNKITLIEKSIDEAPPADSKDIGIVSTPKPMPKPEYYKSMSLSPPMEYKPSRNALSHSLSEGNMGQKFKIQVQDIEAQKKHREKTGINKWFEDYKELVRGKSIFHRRLGIISPTPIDSRHHDMLDNCTNPTKSRRHPDSRKNTTFQSCTHSLKDRCINPLNDYDLSPSSDSNHDINSINSVESSRLNPIQATSNLSQSGLQSQESNKKPTRRHQIPTARRRKPRSDLI